MKLISFIYESSATKPFTEPELMALLKQCRTANTRAGLTGLLLYKNGAFLQLLEGDQRVVEKLYSKIESDPRHFGCTQVRWESITERRFTEWSMGFKNLADVDLRQTPGYSEFLNEPLTSPIFKADPSRARKLLLLFAANP